MPVCQVTGFQAHVVPVWPDPGYTLDDAIRISRLKICVRQPRLEPSAEGDAQRQLSLIRSDSRMRKEGVITAWNDKSYKWSQDYWPLTHVVLQPDSEVLCAAV